MLNKVTSMVDLWDALSALYYMHYNYIGVLWNIQTRLQHLREKNLTQKLTNSAN